MAVTRYSYAVDLSNLNNSHTLATLSIAPGSRVLDLCTADGSVARALNRRGCVVWGIERDAPSASAASEVCERVIQADLESDDAWWPLRGELFDAILALDVLEHLREPASVLRRASEHLKDGGTVIVSLPNVTHGAVRLSLLHGHFQYTEVGLLDRTHLRFFDRASAERLIAEAGLVIAERLRVSRAIDETEIPVSREENGADLLRRIAEDPDATTYQFVFVARPAGEARPSPSSATLSERLLADLEEQRARLAEVEAYARNLARELEARHGVEIAQELQATKEELARRMQELQQKHLELRHAKADISVKQAFIDNLRQETQEQATRIDQLGAEMSALRVYAGSAGFRLVERIIALLKPIPFAFTVARAVVRAIAPKERKPQL